MSKKRKTRKEKEKAQERRLAPVAIPVAETVTYTITAPEKKRPESKPTSNTSNYKTNKYLKHDNTHLLQDVKTIAAASGIAVAALILLYALLSTGTLRLGILGY